MARYAPICRGRAGPAAAVPDAAVISGVTSQCSHGVEVDYFVVQSSVIVETVHLNRKWELNLVIDRILSAILY